MGAVTASRGGIPWGSGDQGIKDTQLLIQGPPAALELLHLGELASMLGCPSAIRLPRLANARPQARLKIRLAAARRNVRGKL